MQKKALISPVLFFAAAIGGFIISIVLLTLPGSAFPTEDWFDKIWLDKWIHIAMFAGLVVLWCLAWRSVKNRRPRPALKTDFAWIAILFTVYGIIMEFVQLYLVAHRSFDGGDIVADAVGSALGYWFSQVRYIQKNRPL